MEIMARVAVRASRRYFIGTIFFGDYNIEFFVLECKQDLSGKYSLLKGGYSFFL